MKDATGNEVVVGMRAVALDGANKGNIGTVKAISPSYRRKGQMHARVSDGDPVTLHGFWSSWLESDELSVVHP